MAQRRDQTPGPGAGASLFILFNFIKRNFHPAPHCPSARIHSSASILKTSNSPKPASNSFEFPSNSPSNSPSPTRKMLSPWGPRMLPSAVSGHYLQCFLRNSTVTETYIKALDTEYHLIARSVSPERYSQHLYHM